MAEANNGLTAFEWSVWQETYLTALRSGNASVDGAKYAAYEAVKVYRNIKKEL